MEWTHALALFAMAIVNLGTIIALHAHLLLKVEAQKKDIGEALKSMYKEDKLVYGRLERQDAEFQAHLLHCHGKTKGQI